MSAPTTKRHWFPRLRFSLRTLMFFVLLVGSGATLWWNWGPWAVAFTVEEPGMINQVFFSEDDRYVMFSYTVPVDPTFCAWKTYLDIRRADTGVRCALLTNPGTDFAAVKGDYALLLQWSSSNPPLDKSRVAVLFNWVSGKQLKQFPNDPVFVGGNSNSQLKNGVRLSADHIAVWANGKCAAYRLPSFEPDGEWTDVSDAQFLGDGRLLLNHSNGPITIHDLKTGRIVTAKGNGAVAQTMREPLGRFVCMGELLTPAANRLLDTETGTLSRSMPGSIEDFSPDGTRAIIVENKDKPTQRITAFDVSADRELRTLEYQWVTFSPNGKFAIDTITGEVFDTSDFKPLYSAPGMREFSPNGLFLQGGGRIHDGLTNRELMNLRLPFSSQFAQWKHPGRSFSKANEWSHYSLDFVRYTIGEDSDSGARPADGTDWRRATVWHLRCPIEWYGVAWLPEFWLTVTLSITLVWRLWRDHRMSDSTAKLRSRNTF